MNERSDWTIVVVVVDVAVVDPSSRVDLKVPIIVLCSSCLPTMLLRLLCTVHTFPLSSSQ